MPLTWVDPAILVQYRGLTVYYTYKNDDINNQSEVWFSLNDDGTDAFDVRDLPVPDYISEMDYKKIVMNAIDQGNLAEYIALLEKGSLQTLIIPSVWTDIEFHLLLAFADK
ncbi:hypothetical protein, partial [Paenibacillus glucanolyticus]|uniref:hypothetical protein n=1 Tax=Paenibacillus glucanolyticus TaxID=59843 RepID=UPI00097A3A6C